MCICVQTIYILIPFSIDTLVFLFFSLFYSYFVFILLMDKFFVC